MVAQMNLIVVKLPYLRSNMLRTKLAKGMGHNFYGEPAWPNDILYVFPIVILGCVCVTLGLAIGEPMNIGDRANPFATPLEILPEWYFFPTFNLLRILPDKFLGVISMVYVPVALLVTTFIENVSKYQQPYRRPVAVATFLVTVTYSIWLGIGSLVPLSDALPLV